MRQSDKALRVHCASTAVAMGIAAVGSILVVAGEASAFEHNAVVWPAELMPLPLTLRPAPPRSVELDVIDRVVGSAIDVWNAVPCASLDLIYSGIADLPIVEDDDQVLGWVSDAEEWTFGSQSAGATLIHVMPGVRPRVDIAFNDVTFTWVVDASTFVTPEYRFGVDPPLELDPASVVTHEIGHLIGLAHPRTNDPVSQPDALATMSLALLPNAQQKSLSGDDKIGLCSKYPLIASACATDDECTGEEYCREFELESDAVHLCEETRGTFGDLCGRDDYSCGGMCLFTNADYTEGFCTALCESEDECPDLDGQWTCSSAETTTGAEVSFCCPPGSCAEGDDDSDGGPSVSDSGFPRPVDSGFSEDTERDVGAETDTSESDPDGQSDSIADVSPDAEDQEDGETGGSKGGCASTPLNTGRLEAIFPAGLAFVIWLRRRRRGR